VRSHKKKKEQQRKRKRARKPEEAPKGTPGEQGSRKTSAAARRDRRNKSKELEHGTYSKGAQKTGFMNSTPAEVVMNDTDEDCQDLADTMPGNIKKQDRINMAREQATAGSSQRAEQQHEHNNNTNTKTNHKTTRKRTRGTQKTTQTETQQQHTPRQ
jgi:hypothetical protein